MLTSVFLPRFCPRSPMPSWLRRQWQSWTRRWQSLTWECSWWQGCPCPCSSARAATGPSLPQQWHRSCCSPQSRYRCPAGLSHCLATSRSALSRSLLVLMEFAVYGTLLNATEGAKEKNKDLPKRARCFNSPGTKQPSCGGWSHEHQAGMCHTHTRAFSVHPAHPATFSLPPQVSKPSLQFHPFTWKCLVLCQTLLPWATSCEHFQKSGNIPFILSHYWKMNQHHWLISWFMIS